MKQAYTVYKLLDEAGETVWVGSTFYPIGRRLDQHRKFYGMEFADLKVLGTFSTQAEAMAEEDRLLKECIEKNGRLPLYVLMAYCHASPSSGGAKQKKRFPGRKSCDEVSAFVREKVFHKPFLWRES